MKIKFPCFRKQGNFIYAGADNGIRTRDLSLTKTALCLLSYISTKPAFIFYHNFEFISNVIIMKFTGAKL